MIIHVNGWQMVEPSAPLALRSWDVSTGDLAPGDAVVRVVGCGVCHTDLGFLYEGVKTKHALPLTLGHEVAGIVEAQGGGLSHLEGKAVVVPAVLPCGECPLCRAGRGSICPKQVFPGNDVQGGFASHLVVPGRFLCPVDEAALARAGLELADLSVVADAVSTPYQAVRRAEVGPGDVVICIGVGGIGAFGAQIARALGARVIAVDVDPRRLELAQAHGAEHAVNAKGLDAKAVREAVRAFVEREHLDRTRWKIFETSGTTAGQLTAFGLLTYGSVLSVVGFTRQPVEVRLSNLMAFDAVARGSWACDPALYPEIIAMVLEGKINLGDFIDKRPMSRIQETIDAVRRHEIAKRPILVPDFQKEGEEAT
ncbi:MAG: 6-hydroxycyclohex-1-ene-1-carbonyl-CoA dehydrogenase [Deltaproteobacteria bacterium]|nr:6-hydroxycyclohex-1-ene-1-carbonyl-CoA dehydrogenase [Deltaproteobacteria bacterium]